MSTGDLGRNGKPAPPGSIPLVGTADSYPNAAQPNGNGNGPRDFAQGATARAPLGRYSGETVIAVGAHPDDLELGVGGTLSLLARAGANVVGVIASIPNRLEERSAEARAAAKIVGMRELRFLVPGMAARIEDFKGYELVSRLEALLAELGPAALLSHSRADFHRDHVIIHNACLEASRVGFFDFFTYYPTMCRPVAVDFHPRVYVDITETIETKMEAIHAYPSQFQNRELETDFCRAQAREHGRRIGVQYAEAMQVVRMKLS